MNFEIKLIMRGSFPSGQDTSMVSVTEEEYDFIVNYLQSRGYDLTLWGGK